MCRSCLGEKGRAYYRKSLEAGAPRKNAAKTFEGALSTEQREEILRRWGGTCLITGVCADSKRPLDLMKVEAQLEGPPLPLLPDSTWEQWVPAVRSIARAVNFRLPQEYYEKWADKVGLLRTEAVAPRITTTAAEAVESPPPPAPGGYGEPPLPKESTGSPSPPCATDEAVMLTKG